MSDIDIAAQESAAPLDAGLPAENDEQPPLNLPLSMQTSSLLIQDGLDIEHGWGGMNSAKGNDDSQEPGAILVNLAEHNYSKFFMNQQSAIESPSGHIQTCSSLTLHHPEASKSMSEENVKDELSPDGMTIDEDPLESNEVTDSDRMKNVDLPSICDEEMSEADISEGKGNHDADEFEDLSTSFMHSSSQLMEDKPVSELVDEGNLTENKVEKLLDIECGIDSECLVMKPPTDSLAIEEQSCEPIQMHSPSVQNTLVAMSEGSMEDLPNISQEPSAKRIKLDQNNLNADDGHPSVCPYNSVNGNNGPGIPYRGNNSSEFQNNMEFDILDELESTESDNEANDKSDDDSSISGDGISDDEIYAMLDEGLKYTKPNREDEFSHEVREKVVLKVKGHDHFDVLPEGWIEITHNSGMPVYLHKQSRVCCMSKPYFLGPGSTRRHEIPISAIPCLHYAKELEKEQKRKETQSTENGLQGADQSEPALLNHVVNEINAEPNGESNNIVVPSAKVQCVEESKKEGSLDYMAIREYCKKRFEFQTIAVRRFKTWISRRRHQKMVRRAQQRPTLPENTKLITCPLLTAGGAGANKGSMFKKEFIMNPVGKSAVCILHEYVQHTLRLQPRYVFRELENASTPYGAVVIINGMEYGSGFGSSKKQAKTEAAKSALRVLIPNMQLFNSDEQVGKECQDVEFFDQIRVEDPRVSELCVKAGHPYPYQILLECLKRNYGMGNTDVKLAMHNLKHQKNEFLITVGKHKASVICKNKRDGKQRASQAILQKLHPQITSWGSLLRMYGPGSRQTLREKKLEEQRITELQSNACANKPNMSILNKLKEEMLKYHKVRESMKPIGKLVPERKEIVSTSDSNLKNVDL